MGQFTKLVRKTFNFEDEEVVVTYARLKRKHIMKIIPIAQQFEKPDADTVELATKLLDEIGEQCLDYIKSVEGLTDASNEPVTVEQVVNEAYFFELLADIVAAMVEDSLAPGKKKGG